MNVCLLSWLFKRSEIGITGLHLFPLQMCVHVEASDGVLSHLAVRWYLVSHSVQAKDAGDKTVQISLQQTGADGKIRIVGKSCTISQTTRRRSSLIIVICSLKQLVTDAFPFRVSSSYCPTADP